MAQSEPWGSLSVLAGDACAVRLGISTRELGILNHFSDFGEASRPMRISRSGAEELRVHGGRVIAAMREQAALASSSPPSTSTSLFSPPSANSSSSASKT